MTDPTPEERAYNLGISIPFHRPSEARVAEEIRAAVAAERERAAKVAEGGLYLIHFEIAAAIRKEPDES